MAGEGGDAVPELLVTVQLTFPSLDRSALAAHLAPMVQSAIAAGGSSTSISVQPYDPEDAVQ